MAEQSPLDHARDETLCRLFTQGNQYAGHLMIRRYMPLVRRRANAFRKSGLETDDLVQEGLLGLLYAIRAYDTSYNASFATFAFTCVTNRMISLVATADRRPLLVSLDNFTEKAVDLPVDLQEDPQEILVSREETERWIRQAKELLTVFEFKALQLYLSGYSYREMAASLESSSKAVDNALQRARRKLRTR